MPFVSSGPRRFGIEPLESRTMLSSAPFRPAAVPLLTSDPYFSVWSAGNNLTDVQTTQWDNNSQPLVSLIRIDGTTYRLMGTDPSSAAAFPQLSLTITPTRSIYTFGNGQVAVTLTFETAALPGNLDVMTRPLTYINWDVHSVDGLTHSVQLYDSASSLLTVSDASQVVTWGRATTGPLTALHVGTVAQTLLQPFGDEVAIDYGYLYVSAGTSQSQQSVRGDAEEVAAFTSTGAVEVGDDIGTRAANSDQPVLAFSFNLGNVGAGIVSRHVVTAYDEIYETDYFGQNLLPYWKRNGQTMLQLLPVADSQYAGITAQCVTFDNSLTADLTTVGGPEYAQLTALAYRQALTATGIAADADKQPLLFTKEDSSNGDIATSDVIFPTDPIFFLLSPTLAKASLVPLLAFAASSSWTYPYAPHDIGTYPQAVGDPSGNDGNEQQPVEESGNMLIMVDTIAHEEGSAEFANNYWGDLTRWAQYLVPYAYDPGSQLTTDDFLGTIQSSTNLAIKAIEALGAYSQLCTLHGDVTDATTYRSLAQADEQHLLQVATDGNHLRLGYYLPNSWSQDYNLVWDKILGNNLFPTSVAAGQVAYYKTIVTQYGLPVESGNSTAKSDWSTWNASLATNLPDFETLFNPVYNFITNSGNRVPLQDSYDVNNINAGGFQGRSVVGGLFIRMLDFPSIWQKWSSQDTTALTGWAPQPVAQPLLPDALTSPQNWKYTTATPASNWTSQSFDDSSWASGLGGFGTASTPGAIVNTTWSGVGTIYLRKSFTMPTGTFSNLMIQAYHDETMTVYIDGVQAVYAAGYITGYQDFPISAAATAYLTSGATVEIAVSCNNTTGGQDIDVGIVNIASVTPLLPDALTIPQTWSWTTTTPVGNWQLSSYDSSSWSNGLGGFGNASTPGALVNTNWLGVNTIYLRKSFTMPAGNYTGLEIQAYHDETMNVYFNGVLAVTATGYATSYQLFPIASAALGQLTAGALVEVAVSCANTGGGQDIDVGIVNVNGYTTPGVAPAAVKPKVPLIPVVPVVAVPPVAVAINGAAMPGLGANRLNVPPVVKVAFAGQAAAANASSAAISPSSSITVALLRSKSASKTVSAARGTAVTAVLDSPLRSKVVG